jgi:hypothetical protein
MFIYTSLSSSMDVLAPSRTFHVFKNWVKKLNMIDILFRSIIATALALFRCENGYN